MPLYPIKGRSLLGGLVGMSPTEELKYGISGLMPMQLPAVPSGINLSPMEIQLYDNIFKPQTTEDLLRLVAQDRVKNAMLTGNSDVVNDLLTKISDYPTIKQYILQLLGGK